MDKLAIIDDINKHKKKKFLASDKNINNDDYYIAYTKKPKEYIKLATKGKKELYFANNRPLPIFQGFVDDKTCVILVSGARGNGKSLFGSAIAEDYHKLNPNNKIYLVCSTSKKSDENMSKQKYIQDFDLTSLNDFKILDRKAKDDLTEEDKDAEAIFNVYHDALFIFDDIDNLSKEVQKRLNNFFNLLLELGRKKGVSILKISHFETNGHESRLLMREFDYYVTFNDDALQTNRLLNNYRKTDTHMFMPDETYLIFNFKYGYCLTNKRIFMLH